MAVPVKPRDLLSSYISNSSNPAWARDLVCLAITTGGRLSDADNTLIWEEMENGVSTPSQTLPAALGVSVSKVTLTSLKHVSGVNALADDQEIEFCENGITLLYGQNRSGKSGYFRIINQLAKGEIPYSILPNVFDATPNPISVSINYKLDGVAQPVFNWDCVTTPPVELRHIRVFDSQYAAIFLKPRGGNIYLFDSYHLRIFRGIHDTLHYLKEDLELTIDAMVETALDSLCTVNYRDNLKQALVQAFDEELKKLGMEDVQVKLEVDDLLANTSEIKISLTNRMDTSAVLSEAELKCASLALFLAENDLMEVKQPLVFDDPVNSLDSYFISAFANRLSELKEHQVIVFTHNILLQEALSNERAFKVYYGTPGIGGGTTKRIVWFYDVLTSVDRCGYVIWHEKKKTLFYLKRADEKLSATPVTDTKGIVDDLRMAVEWAIDEVVFRGLATRRFKGAEDTNWTGLEIMASAGSNNVRELKKLHADISGMGIHLSYSSHAVTTNPRKLRKIMNDILRIYQTVDPGATI